MRLLYVILASVGLTACGSKSDLSIVVSTRGSNNLSAPLTLSLSASAPDSTIYYSLATTDSETKFVIYTLPLKVSSSQYLKAYAEKTVEKEKKAGVISDGNETLRSDTLSEAYLFKTDASGAGGSDKGGTDTDTGSAGSGSGPIAGGNGPVEPAVPTPTLSNAEIVGGWRSEVCYAGTKVSDGGGNFVLYDFYFRSDNTYSFIEYWYKTNWYGTYQCRGDLALRLEQSGNYAVGANTSATGTTFNIQFTNTLAQISVDSDAGTSSGFSTMGFWLGRNSNPASSWAFAAGTTQNVNGLNCAFSSQPALNQKMNNILQFNGTTLQTGSFPETTTGPGVFDGATIPALLSKTFNKL